MKTFEWWKGMKVDFVSFSMGKRISLAKASFFLVLATFLVIFFLKSGFVSSQEGGNGDTSTLQTFGVGGGLYWDFELIQEEPDNNADGLPDVITTMDPLDLRMLEVYVNQTTNKGGYKWKSAICNVSGFNDVGKYEYNPATEIWTYTGSLNYDKLIYYGMPSDWCSESNGEGFILFGAGSGDKRYRLNFSRGQVMVIKSYTGTGSNIEYWTVTGSSGAVHDNDGDVTSTVSVNDSDGSDLSSKYDEYISFLLWNNSLASDDVIVDVNFSVDFINADNCVDVVIGHNQSGSGTTICNWDDVDTNYLGGSTAGNVICNFDTSGWTTAELNSLNVSVRADADCDGGGADHIEVDYGQLIVEYNQPIKFSGGVENDTEVFEGDNVNHTIDIAGIPDPQGYIFSWNGTDACTGGWSNSSYVEESPKGWNVSAVGVGCGGKSIGWKFYANNTVGWNDSIEYDYYVYKYGTLEVNLTTPADNTTVTQNTTFNFNASVKCIGGAGAKCGTISAYGMYNSSGAVPNELINTTEGATPFYLVGIINTLAYWRPTWTNESGSYGNVMDKRYGDKSTVLTYLQTSCDEIYKFNITSNPSNPILYVTSYAAGSPYTSSVKAWDYGTNSWDTVISVNSPLTERSVSLSTEYIDNGEVTVCFLKIDSNQPVYDTYITTTGNTYDYWGITQSNSVGKMNVTETTPCGDAWCSDATLDNEFTNAKYLNINQSDNSDATGTNSRYTVFHIKINESENDINSIVLRYEGYRNTGDPILYVWNSSDWEALPSSAIKGNIQGSNKLVYYEINESISNYLDSDGYFHIYDKTGGSDWSYTDYIKVNIISEAGAGNPQTSSTLNDGETWYANWSVNATGPINSSYEIGVLFNSSYGSSNVADNHTSNSTVNIIDAVLGNSAPTIAMDAISDVNLAANSTVKVWCNATVTDTDACSEITVVWAQIYNLSDGYVFGSGSDNNSLRYTNDTGADNTGCAIEPSCSGASAWVNCSFDVFYYATYGNSSDAWGCNITANDSSSASGYNDTINFDINQLIAIGIKEDKLEFSELTSLGATSTYPVNTTIENQGNILQMDVIINETDSEAAATVETLDCTKSGGTGTINTSLYIQYNATNESFLFAGLGDATLPGGYNLTGDSATGQTVDLNIDRNTSDTQGKYAPIYWKMKIPSSGVGGTCNGTVTFIATQ